MFLVKKNREPSFYFLLWLDVLVASLLIKHYSYNKFQTFREINFRHFIQNICRNEMRQAEGIPESSANFL